MTIEELEEKLIQLQNEINAAVGPIISRLRLPHAVSAHEITIPLLDVTTYESQGRENHYVCGPSQISVDLEIDTTMHSTGRRRLATK